MKCGMLCRGDARGLGIQTWEIARHLKPESIVIVDMKELSPYPMTLDYTGFSERIQTVQYGKWMQGYWETAFEGCDVVLSCETFYDQGLPLRLEPLGIKTVVQANFEFLKWRTERLPVPNLFLAPSMWRIDDWPPNLTVYLPTPVATDKLPYKERKFASDFLHIGGHAAAHDRNGTRVMHTISRDLPVNMRLRILGQKGIPPIPGKGANISGHVDKVVENYWDLYGWGDALVMPRRYGGQSLVAQEALSTGMPLIVADREPERRWPALYVPTYHSGTLATPGGDIEIDSCTHHEVFRKMKFLLENEDVALRLSQEGKAYREAHAWKKLLPVWKKVLKDVVAGKTDWRLDDYVEPPERFRFDWED